MSYSIDAGMDQRIWNFYLDALIPFDLKNVRADRAAYENANPGHFGWEDVIIHLVDKNKVELYGIAAAALGSIAGGFSTTGTASYIFSGISVVTFGLTFLRINSIYNDNVHYCLTANARVYRDNFMK